MKLWEIARLERHYVYSITFSGIILFFFLMATAFIGYVLPFGQMSFWGATVITNLLSPFPSLIEWVSGGPTLKITFLFSIYNLSRFYKLRSNNL